MAAPYPPPKKSAPLAYEDQVLERQHRLHRARVENTKSCIDCHLPPSYLNKRLSRAPEAERIYQIEHENHLLVQRMTRIMNEDSCIDNKNPNAVRRSNGYSQRMRDLEHLRIEKENRQILARIERSKTSYPLEKMQRDSHQHDVLAARIGRYQRPLPK